MQQTETYKLNLIETSDPFSPQALNENTQKLEEVVSEKLEDMDRRIQVFEAKKFVYGNYYNPNNKEGIYEVKVGFRPKIVSIAHTSSGFIMAMATDAERGEYSALKLTDTGFIVSSSYVTGPVNFIALG